MDDITAGAAIKKMIGCLAASLCRRPDFDRSEHEDLCQEMRLAILQEAESYDSSRGPPSAWAYTILGRWSGSEVRRRSALKRRDMYLSRSIDAEQEGGTPARDMLTAEDGLRRSQAGPTPDADVIDMVDTIRAASARLDPCDMDIWRRLAEGTAAAVARDLGLTAYAVRKAKKRIRESIELVTNQEKL